MLASWARWLPGPAARLSLWLRVYARWLDQARGAWYRPPAAEHEVVSDPRDHEFGRPGTCDFPPPPVRNCVQQ